MPASMQIQDSISICKINYFIAPVIRDGYNTRIHGAGIQEIPVIVPLRGVTKVIAPSCPGACVILALSCHLLSRRKDIELQVSQQDDGPALQLLWL